MKQYFVIIKQSDGNVPLTNNSEVLRTFDADTMAHVAGLNTNKPFEIFKIGEGVDFSWTLLSEEAAHGMEENK